MAKESIWGSFINNYFKPQKNEVKEEKDVEINTGYNSWEDDYYNSYNKSDNKKANHITDEEEYAKFVEEHMVDEGENIETIQDMMDDAMFDGQPIELQETQETHLEDGVALHPADEPEFTAEEIEAFKALNKINEVHEINEQNVIDAAIPDETRTVETKVNSVKISKPKVQKPVKNNKEPKAKTPKTPKKK